ncbi:MAG: aspartyl protease family protein [Candidatus Eremiobacteraeota bacterium]|nr:aspartyl protease family protein [Candidatus Eremiobacteraeota bacterium]MBV8281707.1 aspartyl protease family protein [Candidatus Eremiobacteraeota bacterium]
MSATFCVIALLVAAFEAFAPDASAAAEPSPLPSPPGFMKTTTSLTDVVAAADKAFGHPQQPVHSTTETFTVTSKSGTALGTMQSIGNDYTVTTTQSDMTLRYGAYQGQRWEQNYNGETTLIKGIHQEAYANFGLLWRIARLPGARLLGEVAVPSSYVVEVTPEDGPRTWLFFDKTSGLLDQAVEFGSVPYRMEFTRYQSVDGVTLANHVHFIYSSSATDEDLTSRRYNDAIAPEALQIPKSRTLVEFPASVSSTRLPAHIAQGSGRVVIRITIAGRGLDLLLDSGSSGIVLDRTVASELGLTPVGHLGPDNEQLHAMVPEIDIGQLRMHNAIVETADVEDYPDETTKVVGLLGYDFIKGAVLKIDYVHGTVDAYDPSSFVAPPGAQPIEATLDDYVPMVACVVGNATAQNVIVDTGSYDMLLVFSHFANAHFNGTPDPNKNVFARRFFPLMGGYVPVAQYYIGSVQFGGFTFGDVLAYVTYHVPEFEMSQEDSDGIMGQSFLLYFDVYFDYPHRLLYVTPNQTLNNVLQTPKPAK